MMIARGSSVRVAIMVGASLSAARLVGNIYTGSSFLALASLLETENNQARSLAMYFYGSGCSAKFVSGKIIAGKCDFGLRAALEKRRLLTVSEYDKIAYGIEK